MDHTELAERLEKRFDKLETQLDEALSQSTTNKADLVWVRGYIKTSITLLIALIIGAISTFFKSLKGL